MPSASAPESIALVVKGSRALAAAGQSDMVWGHASVRDPEDRGVWMKSSGWGLEEIDEDKVVLVSPAGEVLYGAGRRHIEYPIHTEIMARRADVGAVVHTHSDAANAFAALDVPLRPISHAGSLFAYPDVPRFTLTGGLISTPELGQALADALGPAPGCLMPQHGLVAAGKDLPGAVMNAVLLDRVPAVGAEDDRPPARPQHASHLGHRLSVVLHVFDHLVGEDQVEGVIGKGQVLGSGAGDPVSDPVPRLLGSLQLEVDAHRLVSDLAKPPHVGSDSATVVEHAGGAQVARVLGDHPQAPILAGPPDV